MKNLSRFILFLLSVFCGYFQVEGKTYILAFATTGYESSLTDTLDHVLRRSNSDICIIPIIVNKNSIEDAVTSSILKSDSLHNEANTNKCGVMGIGAFGSAAALKSANQISTEFAVLISALGQPGRDFIYRFLSTPTYLQGFSQNEAKSIRKGLRDSLFYNSGNNDSALAEFRELLTYDPSSYLSKINCPVYSVFGLNDNIMPWFENVSGIETGLPFNDQSRFIVSPGTGYALLSQSDPSLYPLIGDARPDRQINYNSDAISDLISWIGDLNER